MRHKHQGTWSTRGYDTGYKHGFNRMPYEPTLGSDYARGYSDGAADLYESEYGIDLRSVEKFGAAQINDTPAMWAVRNGAAGVE